MVFLFTAMSLWLGMFLAWGWGAIVMKAAQAARPSAETQAQLLHLEQIAQQRANQTGLSVTEEVEILVFDGYMLDARVSTVFLVLGLLFIYVLALMRMKNPKFVFTQLFGMIITDFFMTYGPLMPSFDGTLPTAIIIPASIGLGLAFVASLVIFPQSASHITLEMTEKIVAGLKVSLKALTENFPDSESKEQENLAALNGTKQMLLGQWQGLQPILGFLKLDLSIGRWSDKDIMGLQENLRGAFIGTVNILNLRLFRLGNSLQARKALEAMPSDPATPPASSSSDEGEEDKHDATTETAEKAKTAKKNEVGSHQINEFSTFLKAITDADSLEVQAETIDLLRKDGADVINTCIEALDSVQECIHAVNTSRLFSRLSQETFDKHVQQSETALEKLRAARASFLENTTNDLLHANAELFDTNGRVKTLDSHLHSRFRAVTFGMVFEEHVLSAVDGVIPLLEKTVSLYKERPNNRIWFPAGIRHIASWIFKRSEKAPVNAETPFADPDKDLVDQSDLLQQKLGIVRGARKRPRSKLAVIISGSYHFLVSPDSLYALRMVIVSLALTIPAVIPQSASFYYKQRGLWALITGQTTMLAYMADFTFSVLGRVAGTVIGGVLGLLAWYIGSGNGEGNSYGLAAIVGVMLIPLLSARLFLSRMFLLPSMMCAATFLLVIGYSFDYG
jgi:Putative ER transporter, 6TM, N-terminal/Fusaric acid resistance protein-like